MLKIAEVLNLVRLDLSIVGEWRWILTHFTKICQMFQIPWTTAMSIAATRMYRSLSDFLSFDV